MRRALILAATAVSLAGCNQQPSVSLTNASPQQVAAAAKASGVTASMFNPGKWETKVEMLSMDMPGMEAMPPAMADKIKAALMKPHTVSSCMSAQDAKRPSSDMFTGKGKSGCRFDKYEMSGGRIEASMTCPGPEGAMTMHMTGTFSPESFALDQQMDMTSPRGAMHSKAHVTGRRVGDCGAGDGAK